MRSFGLTIIILLLSMGELVGQADSTLLMQAIHGAEDNGIFPEALQTAGEVNARVQASSCHTCKVHSYYMMGRINWVDGYYDASIGYFKKALMLLPKADSMLFRRRIYSSIGLNFYYQGYYDSALYYHQKAFDILQSLNSRKDMPRVLNHIALVYHRKGDYARWSENLFKMEGILSQLGDNVIDIENWGGIDNLLVDTVYFKQKIADNLKILPARLAQKEPRNLLIIYQNLARAHSQLKENLVAARYWKKMAELMESLGQIPYWNEVAVNYRDANMKDSSFYFHYLFKSKYLDRSTRITQSSTQQDLGDDHYHFESYDSALHYFRKAFRMSMEMNNRIAIAGLYRRLTETYLKLGRLKEAESEMLDGLALADQVSLLSKRNLLKSGISIYQKMGQVAKALEYSMAYTQVSDSLNRQETIFNLIRLQAQYQTAKKDRDMKALQSANIEQQMKLNSRNSIMLSLGTISVAFLGFIIVLFEQRTRIRKKNKALDLANQEQTTLLKEVHHRVKNNLQFIASLINLQSSHANGEATQELEKIRSRVMSIALIHKKLYAHENMSSIDLQSFLNDLVNNILSAFSTGVTLEKQMDIVSIKVDIESAIPIGLIVHELVTNSLEHGLSNTPHPKLNVKLVQQNSALVLTVSDNGSGNKKAASLDKERGFGLKLVEILLRRLSGTFEVSFENGTHSRVELNHW